MSVASNSPVTSSNVNTNFMSRSAATTSTVSATTFSNTTESTTKDTGAVIVEGGVGIEKNLNVGGNLVVSGDLTVQGTTTTLNTVTMELEDPNILINNGGDNTTAEGAGITIERAGTNGSLKYEDALASKFKVGALGSESEILTASTTQIVTGNKDFQGDIKTDVIAESTAAAGVTIDGVLIKDGLTDGVDVSAHAADATIHFTEGSISHANILNIGTNTHAQIDTHIGSTSNPHSVTASQVGLGSVTNDSQLKRAAADFNSFTEKTTPVNADIVLIEDSADSYNKKKVQLSNLGLGGTTSLSSSYDIENLAIACSVGSNALTIALKDNAGSDPTAGSPVKIGFRSSTLTSGVYNIRSATAALSLVISSGSTLGHASAQPHYIYVYAIDNAGAIELAASSKLYEENTVISTTAEGGAGAADSETVIYSTTARTNVPIRLIARLTSTQTTAGTWAAVPTEISLLPFSKLILPTIQKFTSGSGTYTTPVGVKYIKVKMAGGGGGGCGSGSASYGNGSAGNATTFGTTLLVANGGSGAGAGPGAGGGSASLGTGPIGVAITGGQGGSYQVKTGGAGSGIHLCGGHGGNTPFFSGGGSSAAGGYASSNGNTNTGGGGGGGGDGGIANGSTGAGGGSGGFVDAIILNPFSSYSYSVGTGGAGGTAGTSGYVGGDGGSGIIIVEEHY